MIKVCVIGLGYVGLPICLKSSYKFKTVGFDTNKLRIKNLNKKLYKKNLRDLKSFFCILNLLVSNPTVLNL